MTAQTDKSRQPNGAHDPDLRPDHRKGKQPIGLYVAALAVIVLLVGGIVWLNAVFRGGGGGGGGGGGTPATTTSPTPSPSTSGKTPTGTPFPKGLLAESAAAVKGASLPFPNAPGVTPETIRSVKPSRNLVAITFNDGGTIDKRILTLLEQRNVRCTTFLTGLTVQADPAFVKRLDADGFEIANRTWDGQALTGLSDAQVRSELTSAQAAISAVTKNQAPYLRPPGGETDARIQRIAASLGYRIVLWNRSFGDLSSSAKAQDEARRVLDGMKPGDIVLAHWGGTQTYEALRLILDGMKGRGFTPVTVSELLKYSSTAAGTAAVQGRGGAGAPAPSRSASSAAGGARTAASVVQK